MPALQAGGGLKCVWTPHIALPAPQISWIPLLTHSAPKCTPIPQYFFPGQGQREVGASPDLFCLNTKFSYPRPLRSYSLNLDPVWVRDILILSDFFYNFLIS